MKNIAIIPARGGSKRIPRENIKSFMGKPIILSCWKSLVFKGVKAVECLRLGRSGRLPQVGIMLMV